MASDRQAHWRTELVLEACDVANDMRRIVLSSSGGDRVPPGAHVDISLKIQGRDDTRSYSIVEAVNGGSALAITVALAPESRGGSSYMHTLRPGDQVTTTQPLQNFPLRMGAARYVLVAGGTGITAVFGMASALKRAGEDYEVVYAGRSRARMAYLDELDQEHGAALRACIAEEGTPLDVAALVDGIAAGPAATELYMCGPIRLMDAIRRRWASTGLEPSDLRYETFGNSGWFDAEPFEIRVPRLGIEATVRRHESLLECLERAGADMMFDCRRGECGLCQVRVLDVEGTIDHRDVFFDDAQKQTVQKMCSCVSRVVRGGVNSPSPLLILELP